MFLHSLHTVGSQIVTHHCIFVSAAALAIFQIPEGLIAPPLVHNVYDVLFLFISSFFSCSFRNMVSYHIVLNFHTFYFQISFISEVAVIL